jgi:hypothetical protein
MNCAGPQSAMPKRRCWFYPTSILHDSRLGRTFETSQESPAGVSGRILLGRFAPGGLGQLFKLAQLGACLIHNLLKMMNSLKNLLQR